MKEKIIVSTYKGQRPSEEDAQKYIQKKFNNKRTPGENTTSTANFLKQQSAEVFHAGHHFIYELLQNADDSEAKEIIFELANDHLIITHSGFHFEPDDVERICDTSSASSTKKNTKPHQSEKIGYKGIGFKAVFAISNQVMVLSGPYRFKFDEIECQKINKTVEDDETEYPWQIMPISVSTEVFIEAFPNINLECVNFVLKNVNVNRVKAELTEILSNPKILIFLKHVNKISVIEKENVIKIKKLKREENILEIRYRDKVKNNAQNSLWLCYTEIVPVPEDTQTAMKSLPDASCPPKIKLSEHTEITLAVEIEWKPSLEEFMFKTVSDAVLYCYLPTRVETIIPYLINANFLLGQDRTDIRDNNPWNEFLLIEIASVQLKWLQRLIQDDRFKKNILCLFSNRSEQVFKLARSLNNAYKDSYDMALKSIPFVPAKDGYLLRIAELVVDETRFFYKFNERMESELMHAKSDRSLLISSELAFVEKLGEVKRYTWQNLQNSIERYMSVLLSKGDYEKQEHMLNFIVSKAGENLAAFSKKKIIVTTRNILASPCDSFMPVTSSSKADAFPADPEVSLNIIDITKYSKRKIKVIENKLSIHALRAKSYIDIYLRRLMAAKKITKSNSVMYLRFIYHACKQDESIIEKVQKRNLSVSDFSQFLVKTQTGKMSAISNCFIQSPYEEAIDPTYLIAREYFEEEDDLDFWKKMLSVMGIQIEVELEWSEDEYSYNTLKEHFEQFSEDLVNSFDLYLANMIEGSNLPPYLRASASKIHGLAENSYIKNMVFFNILFEKDVATETRWLLFLTAIQKNTRILKQSPELRTTTPKKRCELDEQFLLYFFRNHFKVPVWGGGKPRLPRKIFCTPKLLQLAAQFDLPIPVAKFPPHIHLKLNQMKLLGFETELLSVKALEILESVNRIGLRQKANEQFIEQLGLVYKLILSVGLSDHPTQADIIEWKQQNKLLACNGNFYSAMDIEVYDLNDMGKHNEPHLWLHVSSLSIEESRQLAKFLGLSCFSEKKGFVPVHETNLELKESEKRFRKILSVILAVGVVTEAAELSPKDPNKHIHLYEEIIEKFKEINFVCCARIVVPFDTTDEPSATRQSQTQTTILDGNNLYFCGRFNLNTLRGIAEKIAHLLFKADCARSHFMNNVYLIEDIIELRSKIGEGQLPAFKRKIDEVEVTYRKLILEVIEGNEAGNANEDENTKKIVSSSSHDTSPSKQAGASQKVVSQDDNELTRIGQDKKNNRSPEESDNDSKKVEKNPKGKEEKKDPSRHAEENAKKSRESRDPSRFVLNSTCREWLKIEPYSSFNLSQAQTPGKDRRRSSSNHAKKSPLSDEEKAQIGFIGEQLAFFALRKKYQDKSYEITKTEEGFLASKEGKSVKNVIWHNKKEESFMPYDITVQKIKDNKGKEESVNKRIIEVKTSSKKGPSKVYYSSPELRQVFLHRNRYTIFKVSGVVLEEFRKDEVNWNEVKLRKIKDPAETIFKGVNVEGIQAEPPEGRAPIVQMVFKI